MEEVVLGGGEFPITRSVQKEDGEGCYRRDSCTVCVWACVGRQMQSRFR